MKTAQTKPQVGSTLVVVMVVLMTLTVIVGVAADYTMTMGRNVQRSNTLEQAMAIADGCIDWNFAYWRAMAKAATPTTSSLTAIPLPTSAAFPNVHNFTASRSVFNVSSNTTVQQCQVVAVDPEWNTMSKTSATPTPQIGQSSTAVTYNYLATAYVTLPALRGNVVARVQRIFQKQQLSPWNWAIFYNDPLEIHPGPIFNVTGWVHTNGDLYTAHSTLNFLSKVSFAGSWNIAFMPGDGAHNGETPASPTYPTNEPPALDTTHSPFDLDTSVFNTTDSNPNNDGYQELIQPPNLNYSDPLASARYYDQAGIVVTVDANNNVTIALGNGNGTTTTLSGTQGSSTNKALYNMFAGAITTNGSIQDDREGATVRTVTMDMSKLITPNLGATNGVVWKSSAFNGVLYIYDSSGSATVKRGIKVVNGALIPSGGVTIASQNPVYIQGDYNTGIAPPSDSGDPTTPQGAMYTRQPCSVLADAVNILSNSWVDSNSLAGLSSRPASNTTINTAIVSGIVPTANGNYSGGAENFPRFLEDWSNATMTYYGSMVELYTSQQATGIWGKGNVYNPPTRQWYFDTNFQINPPPGSLMTYSYVKGRWSLAP